MTGSPNNSDATRELLEEFMAEIQQLHAAIQRLEHKVETMLRRRRPEKNLMP